MGNIINNSTINHKQIIAIYNILRSIGLNTSHRGAKYINKAIQLVIILSDNDIVIINTIYNDIAKVYDNITQKQIKNDISYALNSRVEEKAIKNFERIFDFEYDSYYFTNKTIIEEIARVVKYDTILK